MGIDRTPSTFELNLFPCEIDETLMAAGEVSPNKNNRFKYSVFNREQELDEEEQE